MPDTRSAAEIPATPGVKGIRVERRYTEAGVHPFEAIDWEIRDAVIGNPEKPAFEQRGVEFPKSWSQNATNIVAQKYFRGQLGSAERESSVKQMVGRVAGTIAGWGRELGYFSTRRRRRRLRVGAHAHPGQPDRGVQLARLVQRGLRGAAAVLRLLHPLASQDELDSILDWNTKEGKIFRGGSGSGINLSNIRGSMEPLTKGGLASGPVSFMRGADAWAGTIKSGGKTRRAAKMVVLDIDHPDIVDFIWCKAREEEKAAALRDAGFDMRLDSEHFASIQYQNANNSVRVTDEFMERAERGEEWETIARVTRKPVDTLQTRATCSVRSPRRRGSAPIRASSTTRRSTSGTPARTRAGSTRPTRARSTCTWTTRRATSRRSTS